MNNSLFFRFRKPFTNNLGEDSNDSALIKFLFGLVVTAVMLGMLVIVFKDTVAETKKMQENEQKYRQHQNNSIGLITNDLPSALIIKNIT